MDFRPRISFFQVVMGRPSSATVAHLFYTVSQLI